MDFPELIVLNPHPSVRRMEADRIGRGRVLGVGLQTPEFVCRAGNLPAPATDEVIDWVGIFPWQTSLAIERVNIDTMTAVSLIGLHLDSGYGYARSGIPPAVVERAYGLTHTKEWVPTDGLAEPTVADAVRRWALSDGIPTLFKRVIVSDYLLGVLSPGKIRDVARQMIEERSMIIKAWEQVEVIADDQIAVIESRNPFAMVAAQMVADVAVWVRPRGILGSLDRSGRQVKISQARPGLVNFAGIHEVVGELEPGWRGDATSGASVEGSTLETDVILRMLMNYRTNVA